MQASTTMDELFTADAVIADISKTFCINPSHVLATTDSFWEWAAIHSEPTDFPYLLANNMLAVLFLLSHSTSVLDELKIRLSHFILSLDICQDDVVRDATIPLELKMEYIQYEMRPSHRQSLLWNCQICSELTHEQIGSVLYWLKLVRRNEHFHHDIDDSLIRCWEVAYKSYIPILAISQLESQ